MNEEVENTQEIINEQKSSIKVVKNSKGYVWEVKVYDNDIDKALEKTIEIEEKCRQKFKEI